VSSGTAGVSNGRSVIWLTGLKGWLVHPITGWGPDGFVRAFDRAVGPSWYAIVEGLQRAANAHDIFVQTLVTIGIPGLVLLTWALVQTGMVSFRGVRSATGPARGLLLGLTAAFVGMVVALAFGVTLPGVSVWLWLTVGLLLAPSSHRVSAPTKAVLAAGVALGVALALWTGSWLVADVTAGWAEEQQTGPAKVAAIEAAVRLNPLSPGYRWLYAESLMDVAVAGQRAGQSPQLVDQTERQAVSAFYVAAGADRGDAMVRVALADVLISYAAGHPTSDAAQRAVQVAQEAVDLAPLNPAALGVLARAYEAAGRPADADKAARLARSVAPAYSMQTLGSLGASATAAP
jgi:hypothetical protein